MKLKNVKHKEILYGEKRVYNFSFFDNRFYLFDKLGRELNSFTMEKVPNILDIEVLEIKKSGYSGHGVGFPTTHIKLDFLDYTKLNRSDFVFGDYDTRE